MARRPPVDERQRFGIQRDPNGMPYVFDDLNRVVQRDASGNLTNMTVDGEPIIGSPSATRRSAQDVQRARKRLEDQQRQQNRQQERQQEQSSAPPAPQATPRPPANPTNVARGDGSQSITPTDSVPSDATPALAPARPDPVDRTQLGPVAQQPIGVFDPRSNVVVSPMAPDYISPMGRTQWTDVRANGRVIPATPTGQQALNALIPGYANMQPEQRANALRQLRADTGLGTGQVTGQVGTVTGRTSLAVDPEPGRSFATAFNPGGATEIRNPLVPGGPQAYGTVNHVSVRDARTGVTVEVPTRSLVAGARVNPAYLGNQDNAPASPLVPPSSPAAPPATEPTKPPAYVPPPSVARGEAPSSPVQAAPSPAAPTAAPAVPLQRSLGREIGETVRDTGSSIGRSFTTENPLIGGTVDGLSRANSAVAGFLSDIYGGVAGTGSPLAPPQLAERRTEPTPSPIVPSNPDLAQRRAADLSFPPATSTGGPIHQPLASSGSAFEPPSVSPGRAIAEAASAAGSAGVGGALAVPKSVVNQRRKRNNE